MGSPGSYNWKGNIFMNSIAEFLGRDKTEYHSPVRDNENPPVEKSSYLGNLQII